MGFGTIGRPHEGAAEVEAKRIIAEKEAAIAVEETAAQIETQVSLVEEQTTDVASLIGAKYAQEQKNVKERSLHLPKVEKPTEKMVQTVSDEELKRQSSRFESRNAELKAPILLALLKRAQDPRHGGDKDSLLTLVNEFYPDPLLADEALDFLISVTLGDLKKTAQEAKQALNTDKGREIKAGRNIGDEVQKYVSLGLGTPSKLRDLYRDITGNPREPISLFLELGDKFSYKEMRKVLAYLFHALGTDLKSQGPSIPPGMLHRLLSEVRNLQAGLGVLHFFRSRMRLVAYLFQKNELSLPQNLTFETMARQFVTLLQERYPTADKVLELASKLEIDSEILAKIIVFSQMRDAVREIALFHFYRSLQHRDEIYKAILEALEHLEEQLDELLEAEYREEDTIEEEKKKKKEPDEEEEEEPKIEDKII